MALNSSDRRHQKRIRDWSGSALMGHKRKSMFSKTTRVGKQRRKSLANAYRISRKTGESLDQLRRKVQRGEIRI